MNRKKKFLRTIALGVMCIMAIVIIGCGNSSSSASAASSGSEKEEEFHFTNTITIIFPYSPGSSLEMYCQLFRKILLKHVDVPVMIEYKPGGNTSIGMNYLRAQPNDGHNLAMNSNVVEVSIATGQVPYTENDFVDLVNFGGELSALYTKADSQFKDLNGLLDYARANPGKLRWGASGTLSWQHIFILQLQQIADIKINYIPYGNTGEHMVALLGGNLDVCSASLSGPLPYAQRGEVRFLAQGMQEETKYLPGVPSIFDGKGLSYEKFGSVPWWTTKCLYMPAGIPEAALKVWDELCLKVKDDPEWIDLMEKTNAIQETFMQREEFTKYVQDTTARWRELYKTL
jgi:tripartite-type tricarboxylate transporter receptor subunit TctC